jgi:hypothetical protein
MGWCDKRETGKAERRICVIGKNRLFSLKPGGKVSYLI